MKKILQYLFEHKTLSREQAKEVLVNIGKGAYNEHEITAFMTVYLMRSITIEELVAPYLEREYHHGGQWLAFLASPFLLTSEVERAFLERTSGAIIVLLLFLVVMNAAAVFLRNRFERRW